MPVAYCIVDAELLASTDSANDPVSLWSDLSGISAEHMTITMSSYDHQFGKAYPVIARLYLPSIWHKADSAKLQTALAQALGEYFHLSRDDIIVITTTVDSGMVVENGELVFW